MSGIRLKRNDCIDNGYSYERPFYFWDARVRQQTHAKQKHIRNEQQQALWFVS